MSSTTRKFESVTGVRLMGKILEVNDLTMGYKQAMVLHNINFHVEEGEQVFIVGRNGAGKTSFLKTICGLLPAAKGTINFGGEDITNTSTEVIAQKGLQYVAQDKVVFTDLTVKMNIALAAHAKHIDLKTAQEEVLKIYGNFEQLWDLRAGNLSGGQREILLIGRAMVGSPKLLLIDEPTEGLAAKVINDIYNILDTVKHRTSAVIVEQNLSVVTRLSDRIYAMKEGKIVKEFDNTHKDVDTKELEQYL